MPFAAGLRASLQSRDHHAASELRRGERLEEVLNRHLATVEEMFEGTIVTSVLLLSADGRRLSHGAGPNLPKAYREAIDGSEIGAAAGSCGTAAYFGRPVYVADIATDPLWADYRNLALAHGLRSCWSTPIRDDQGAVTGTFAIYHRTVGLPSTDEIDAINMIAAHVARAIIRARDGAGGPDLAKPILSLVTAELPETPSHLSAGLLQQLEKLQAMAAELDRCGMDSSPAARRAFKSAADDLRKLADVIRDQLSEQDLRT